MRSTAMSTPKRVAAKMRNCAEILAGACGEEVVLI